MSFPIPVHLNHALDKYINAAALSQFTAFIQFALFLGLQSLLLSSVTYYQLALMYLLVFFIFAFESAERRRQVPVGHSVDIFLVSFLCCVGFRVVSRVFSRFGGGKER
jgi:hypothetical protein